MARIEDLVARVFADAIAVKLTHWSTGSYAAHMALGELYDALDTDEIVETYQGKYGLIGLVSIEPVTTPTNVILALEQGVTWIEAHADEIANGCTPVRNLLDGLMQAYRTGLYKLNNLN